MCPRTVAVHSNNTHLQSRDTMRTGRSPGPALAMPTVSVKEPLLSRQLASITRTLETASERRDTIVRTNASREINRKSTTAPTGLAGSPAASTISLSPKSKKSGASGGSPAVTQIVSDSSSGRRESVHASAPTTKDKENGACSSLPLLCLSLANVYQSHSLLVESFFAAGQLPKQKILSRHLRSSRRH